MVRNTIRTLGAALVVVGMLTTTASAQVTGGTGGGAPGGGTTPGGGKTGLPPDIKKHVKEIIDSGKQQGLPPAVIKAQVAAYLHSVGY